MAEEERVSAEDQDKRDGSGGSSTGNQKKSSMIFTILFLVVNLSGMGVGAYLVYKSTLGWEEPKIKEVQEMEVLVEKEGESPFPVVFTMEPVVTNLAGQGGRTIQVEVNLEMLDEDGFEEVVTLGPSARDSIISILNKKDFYDLESLQGKLFLKDQIIAAVNKILDKGVVRAVFFSKFAVK